ncbi:phospholipase D-like domain-containing protein [Paracraurococcus lichenis]|uniref:Phospholipase D n=1 Tax=Paracraurococcus lichenis TaxID=3064888 RepID=A0ABT9DXU0_9PROT|nr:phospholipase D-like domain-containing protein [Paracraurococcus sp. LOR1-02]MDO9708725.1 phospholipase D-like domain-containing protein [Paracraurococcus sp. LOR1-02]
MGGLALGLPALAGCASIPVLPDGPADPMERHALVAEALDGAPLTEGNKVDVLDGGGAAFAAIFRAIAEARDYVHLEYYTLEDVLVPGTMGPHLFDLLAVKLRQGVAVNLIHDGFGSSATPAGAFEALRAAGARVIVFNPMDPLEAKRGWAPNARDHRKIMVVDGRIGATGGVNLSRVYQNPCQVETAPQDPETACWRDTALRIEGPAVASLQRLFLETWSKQGGEPLPRRDWFPRLDARGPARVRILGSAPGEKEPRYYVTLMSAIAAARQRIWLCTGYFVPTWQQRRALRAAARRGVQVRLLLPSVSDAPPALDAQHAAYDDMLEAGIGIREVQGAILHAKLAVVDGVWSAIGSSNLDRRSVAWNNEVDAVVLGSDTAARLEALLQRDWERAKPVTLAEWEARGLGERIREQTSRLVIDLL